MLQIVSSFLATGLKIIELLYIENHYSTLSYLLETSFINFENVFTKHFLLLACYTVTNNVSLDVLHETPASDELFF